MASKDDYTAIAIGIGALVLLGKWGLPKIPNPFPALGQVTAKAADELTGGLQKDRDESWTQYLFEYDVPFSDKRVPLFPGLVREGGDVYTTGGPMDPGGQMADVPWVAIDVAEPDQPWGKYFFEIDLPGVPAYDVRDVPADIYRNTLGRVLR